MLFSAVLPALILSIIPFVDPVASAAHHAVPQSIYSRPHSLADTYQFDPRDGWEHVNVTNMQYALRHPNNHALGTRTNKKSKHSKVSSISDGVAKAVSTVLEGLKGIGKSEPVTITWYTGHDLLNPSCWSQSGWHPTDASFACALTLDGWTTRPQCFKFLELCNTPKKCVFVRVVDTCAGCEAGSKHVDLTRAAFGTLADYAEGTLTVQLRAATEPTQWHEDLWGPKT